MHKRLIYIGASFAGHWVLALSLTVQHTPSLITCLHPGVCVSVIRSHSLPPDSPVRLCSESVTLTSSSWPQQGLPSLPLCQSFCFSWAAFEVSCKDLWTSFPSYSPAHNFYLIFSQPNRPLPNEVSAGIEVKSYPSKGHIKLGPPMLPFESTDLKCPSALTKEKKDSGRCSWDRKNIAHIEEATYTHTYTPREKGRFWASVASSPLLWALVMAVTVTDIVALL